MVTQLNGLIYREHFRLRQNQKARTAKAMSPMDFLTDFPECRNYVTSTLEISSIRGQDFDIRPDLALDIGGVWWASKKPGNPNGGGSLQD